MSRNIKFSVTSCIGEHGFVPAKAVERSGKIHTEYVPNVLQINYYNKNIDIMRNTYVRDVKELKKLITDAYNNIRPTSLVLQDVLTMLDKYKNKKMCDFLVVLLRDYDNTCKLFSEFYLQLFAILKLQSFVGKLFMKKLYTYSK